MLPPSVYPVFVFTFVTYLGHLRSIVFNVALRECAAPRGVRDENR